MRQTQHNALMIVRENRHARRRMVHGTRHPLGRVLLLLSFLLLSTVHAAAAAGSLVSVEFDRRYSTAEVDAMARERFRDLPAPAARYAVDVYIIQYRSTDLQQQPTVVTAQLFVPHYQQPSDRPVYIFAPGTTGLTDQCRPLREHQIGINWGLYRHHVLAHSGQGLIGMIPEYMHFGNPDRLQPFFIAEAEAHVLLDAIRAVRHYFSEHPATVRPASVFLAGFSQGGHASFAAADYNASYAPEVKIDGIIGYGPTTDVEALFRDFSVIAPSIIYTYAQHYGTDRINPQVLLADRWLPTLEQDVLRLCILGLQSYYPWGPWTLFRSEFTSALVNRRLHAEYPEVHRILTANRTGLSGHGVPALILQGSNDVVIDLDDQERFVVELRRRGSDVRYLIYPNAPHDTRQIGFQEALNWMEDRTASARNRSTATETQR